MLVSHLAAIWLDFENKHVYLGNMSLVSIRRMLKEAPRRLAELLAIPISELEVSADVSTIGNRADLVISHGKQRFFVECRASGQMAAVALAALFLGGIGLLLSHKRARIRNVLGFRALLLVSLAVIVAPSKTLAQNSTLWKGTTTGGDGVTWSMSTNWKNSQLPNDTTSPNFNLAGGGVLNNDISGLTLGVVSPLTTSWAIFFGSSAGSYTLNGNSINIGSSASIASIWNNSLNAQTVNLDLNIVGAISLQADSFNGTLTLGGVVSGSSAGFKDAGAKTLF